MKKIISLFMILTMMLSMAVFADDAVTEEQQIVFTDIAYHWAKPEIETLAAEKIVSGNGTGKFLPDNKISKAEFSSMICKIAGTDNYSHVSLADVSYGDWYYNYAKTMVGRGYLTCDNNRFNPHGEITMREAMAVFYRICGENKNDVTVSDADAIVAALKIKRPLSDWEKQAFAYTSANGMLYKFYGVANYDLERSLTRAEAAVLIVRLKNHLGLSVETAAEEVQ